MTLAEQVACRHVVESRSIVGLALLALWLATPALACLPKPEMTQAEMACCKKMAGDCSMSTGKHPCCQTVATAPSTVASTQSKVSFQPAFDFATPVTVLVQSMTMADGELAFAHLGLPPPSPPGPNSILRI